MNSGVSVGTMTVFAEATVGENEALYLENASQFALKAGEKVALTISPVTRVSEENRTPLIGTVTHYEDPFGPSTASEEWEALR